MTDSSAAHQFQVDLRGVIDLLSRHIYSSPRVFLRERGPRPYAEAAEIRATTSA